MAFFRAQLGPPGLTASTEPPGCKFSLMTRKHLTIFPGVATEDYTALGVAKVP